MVRVSCQIYPASAVGYGAEVRREHRTIQGRTKALYLYVSRLKLMQFYEELPYEPISEI